MTTEKEIRMSRMASRGLVFRNRANSTMWQPRRTTYYSLPNIQDFFFWPSIGIEAEKGYVWFLPLKAKNDNYWTPENQKRLWKKLTVPLSDHKLTVIKGTFNFLMVIIPHLTWRKSALIMAVFAFSSYEINEYLAKNPKKTSTFSTGRFSSDAISVPDTEWGW